MTLPVKNIINRESTDDVKKVISEFNPIIDECVNYGSQILYNDRNPKSDGVENLAPVMLLRHFLETMDGISILINKGNAESSKILLRALFETMLLIEFLFEKDTLKRANAYIVSDIRRQIKAAKRLSPDSQESKSVYTTFKSEGFSVFPDNSQILDINEFIASKEKLLNLPDLEKINAEFEKLKRKGLKNPTWYNLNNGPKNIESLSAYLGQKTLYEILYRKWSGAVHGTDVYMGKIYPGEKDSTISIVQLRYIKDLPEVVLYASLFSFKVFRVYITNRLPQSINEYQKWYFENLFIYKQLKSIKLNVE